MKSMDLHESSDINCEDALTKEEIAKLEEETVMQAKESGFVDEEARFGLKTSGGAVWKWIFPYIADYR